MYHEVNKTVLLATSRNLGNSPMTDFVIISHFIQFLFIPAESDEESDESSDDESDWSSDDDESGEEQLDDSVCPPGCDQVRY